MKDILSTPENIGEIERAGLTAFGAGGTFGSAPAIRAGSKAVKNKIDRKLIADRAKAIAKGFNADDSVIAQLDAWTSGERATALSDAFEKIATPLENASTSEEVGKIVEDSIINSLKSKSSEDAAAGFLLLQAVESSSPRALQDMAGKIVASSSENMQTYLNPLFTAIKQGKADDGIINSAKSAYETVTGESLPEDISIKDLRSKLNNMMGMGTDALSQFTSFLASENPEFARTIISQSLVSDPLATSKIINKTIQESGSKTASDIKEAFVQLANAQVKSAGTKAAQNIQALEKVDTSTTTGSKTEATDKEKLTSELEQGKPKTIVGKALGVVKTSKTIKDALNKLREYSDESIESLATKLQGIKQPTKEESKLLQLANRVLNERQKAQDIFSSNQPLHITNKEKALEDFEKSIKSDIDAKMYLMNLLKSKALIGSESVEFAKEVAKRLRDNGAISEKQYQASLKRIDKLYIPEEATQAEEINVKEATSPGSEEFTVEQEPIKEPAKQEPVEEEAQTEEQTTEQDIKEEEVKAEILTNNAEVIASSAEDPEVTLNAEEQVETDRYLNINHLYSELVTQEEKDEFARKLERENPTMYYAAIKFGLIKQVKC